MGKNDRSREALASVILKATLICENCGAIHKKVLPMTEKWYACECGQQMRGREKGDKKFQDEIEIAQQEAHKEVAVLETALERVKPVTTSAPKSGATKIAYGHYESNLSLLKAGKITRKELIAAVIALGIHKGTAAVQWSKFARANNVK